MKRIEEIYWLRFYGCLAVFSFHLLDRLNQHLDNVFLDLARIPTVLGTPIFIFISIFLFSARYGDTPPRHFLVTRLQYVMTPYLVYGLIYSTSGYFSRHTGDNEISFIDNAIEYLIYAGWHGYFLIIAMQFYAFYWLYTRFSLRRWLPPGPWLIIGSLISIAYWGLTRALAIDPPGYLLWVAPLGWVYLFFLALTLVDHYPSLTRAPWLRRLSHPGWLLATIGLIVVFTLRGELAYSSKETWVVPLFVLFTLWGMRRLHGHRAPAPVKRINEYSFGIYLAHPLFFAVVDFFDGFLHFPLPLYALLLAVVGMAGSIGLNALANRSTVGSVMFGKRLRVA